MIPDPNTIEADCCKLLPWDSQFLSVTIARVEADMLSEASAHLIDAWCIERKVDLLYFTARSDDPPTTLACERYGYHLTDVKTTLEKAVGREAAMGCAKSLRKAETLDLPRLEVIARASHWDSRFYYDGRIPRERCDELFATWIRNSVNGYANTVLVTGDVGSPTGYVTCHLDASGRRGSIGLIAVDSASQGKGLGKLLVEGAIAYIAQQGMDEATVVTQGRNIRAQRLYERCGFLLASMQLHYHKWFTPRVPPAQKVDREETPPGEASR